MRKITFATLGGAMLAAALAVAGCGDDNGTQGTGGAGGTGAGGAGGAAASVAKAQAKLDPTSAMSMAKGDAKFDQVGNEVVLDLKVEGASPGEHAVHIHEKGDCGTTMDAMGMAVPGGGAGGHWNPEMMKHGKFGEGMHHLGDVGNVTVGADGKGTLTFRTSRWSIGTGMPNDVVGKSVVVHAGKDDFMTDPTGNAGGRIACGVISKASP